MRRAGVVTLICLAASFVAGCSGDVGGLASLLPTGEPGAQTTIKPSRAPTPTLEPTAQFFSMCTKVSLSEVQALSPLRTALARAETDQDDLNACDYTSSIDPPVKWPNGFVLTFRDALTADEAVVILESSRDFAQGMYPPVTDVPNVGDKGLVYSETDYATIVEAVAGRYWVQARVNDSGNLEFPPVSRAGKAAAGAKLLELALSRLP
jgi:hypothetical protein